MVSIIIPVYNTGQYLRRCVESALAQTMADIQVILVDDGSDATTAKLCDDLVRTDRRVQVLHKPNGGVSSARNAGLETATGQYVCFLDSDDYLLPGYVAEIIGALDEHDADLAICDVTLRNVDGTEALDTIASMQQAQMATPRLSPQQLLEMSGACWRLMMRYDLVRDNKLRFSTSLTMSEDRLYCLQAISAASRLAYIPQPLYVHCHRGDGCVGTRRWSGLRSLILSTALMHRILSQHWSTRHQWAFIRRNMREIVSYACHLMSASHG